MRRVSVWVPGLFYARDVPGRVHTRQVKFYYMSNCESCIGAMIGAMTRSYILQYQNFNRSYNLRPRDITTGAGSYKTRARELHIDYLWELRINWPQSLTCQILTRYKFLFAAYPDIANRPAKQGKILIRRTVKKKKFF